MKNKNEKNLINNKSEIKRNIYNEISKVAVYIILFRLISVFLISLYYKSAWTLGFDRRFMQLPRLQFEENGGIFTDISTYSLGITAILVFLIALIYIVKEDKKYTAKKIAWNIGMWMVLVIYLISILFLNNMINFSTKKSLIFIIAPLLFVTNFLLITGKKNLEI